MISFKVLVYGHEKNAVDVIEYSLQSADFITKNTSWQNLVENIEFFQPDLVIYYFKDIESCKKINAILGVSKIPYILISSEVGIEYYAKICDATAYVTIPLDVVDFINTVKDVLSI